MRQALERALALEGFAVDTAAGGRDAPTAVALGESRLGGLAVEARLSTS